jgi:hypothetical protein
MVSVRGRFCIDRWEAGTVEASSGLALSPYYPPSPRLFRWVVETWGQTLTRDRLVAFGFLDAGAPDGGAPDAAVALPLHVVMPLPDPPSWQLGARFVPRAVSRGGAVPQGSTPGFVAAEACRTADKRLCREDEWVAACKGERATRFPYGEQYRHGACNVFRADHPARILHGNASEGLSDPRLNQVALEGAALLRETGGSPLCKSAWGADAVFDMVGNLDEWVDEPGGLFLGGFYSRATRNGCEARIAAHPTSYFDYSTGFRCCADLR